MGKSFQSYRGNEGPHQTPFAFHARGADFSLVTVIFVR